MELSAAIAGPTSSSRDWSRSPRKIQSLQQRFAAWEIGRAALGDDAGAKRNGSGDELGPSWGKRRGGGPRRSATSRSYPVRRRCSILLRMIG